ncbi:Protein decapping 5 [Bienertia sinuspersici]
MIQPSYSLTIPPLLHLQVCLIIRLLAGSTSEFSNQVSQPGVPITNYQNNVPFYPPGGNMASWNPSTPPTTNVGGISVPMYWQGYYGPSSSLQTQQQSLFRPVQSLSMPPPVQPPAAQQPVHYPIMTSSLPTGAPNVSAPQSMEFPPALLQPIVSSTSSMHSNVHPVHSSALTADSSTNMMPSKVPAQAVSQSTNSSLVPPVLSNALDRSTAAPLIPNQSKQASTSSMSFSSFSDSRSSVVGKSTSPVLVTPGQFLQPGPTVSQTAQTEQKDVEVVKVSSLASAPQTSTVSATAPKAAENQAPLLPLPSPSNSRMNGVPAQTRYTNRGGRDRRRGNEFSHPVANFTEDFDFEAMNEKFKKMKYGDIWPVYKKDDFFDTLSCNSLDRESRNGRTRFSEQMKLDTETFGNFPRTGDFGVAEDPVVDGHEVVIMEGVMLWLCWKGERA